MNEPKVPDFPNPAHALHRMHENMVAGFDPLGVAEPLLHAQLAWMTHPQELADQSAKFATSLWQLQWHTMQRTLGQPSEDPVRPHADDTRFTDPVWHDSATWDLVKEWYLLTTHSVQDMLYDTPGLSNKDRRRAAFWWRKWLNMMAPSNIFWTNPVAMRKALETRGQSLVDGMRNFLADMAAGEVRMTDPTRFNPLAANITYMPEDYRSSRVQSWYVSMQREIARNMLLDVAYVGNRADDVLLFANYNQAAPNNAAGTIPLQARRPIPEFADITYSFNGGKSQYHAFQGKVDWRVSGQLTLMQSLTLSQTKDNGAGSLENPNGNFPAPQDFRNMDADFGLSSYHQPYNSTTLSLIHI